MRGSAAALGKLVDQVETPRAHLPTGGSFLVFAGSPVAACRVRLAGSASTQAADCARRCSQRVSVCHDGHSKDTLGAPRQVRCGSLWLYQDVYVAKFVRQTCRRPTRALAPPAPAVVVLRDNWAGLDQPGLTSSRTTSTSGCCQVRCSPSSPDLTRSTETVTDSRNMPVVLLRILHRARDGQ